MAGYRKKQWDKLRAKLHEERRKAKETRRNMRKLRRVMIGRKKKGEKDLPVELEKKIAEFLKY